MHHPITAYAPGQVLFRQQRFCRGDSFPACDGNVPFIQPGKAHGDPFPAKTHTAFYFGFAAHVECPGTGYFLQELFDDSCFDTGTDEYFRTGGFLTECN